MNIYEIDRKELESLPLVAEGYKVMYYDGGTRQFFKYTKEIGEPLAGRIFRVNGKIGLCKWGLHFCKNPADVFRTYLPLSYNRYFRVRAYGKVIDAGVKSVAECLEFVDEYDIMEFIKIIKTGSVTDSTAVYGSTSVRNSTAVGYSDAVGDSNIVRGSNGVRDSDAVSWSSAVRDSTAVSDGSAVCGSTGVRGSTAVSGSTAVDCSNVVDCSNDVRGSTAVNRSTAVRNSTNVDCSKAVSDSLAVVSSFGLRNCKAVFRCLFCNGLEGKTLRIFNKETTPERYEEVYEKITSFGWVPKFNNFYDLKGDKAWYTIPFPEVRCVDNKIAWSKMPSEMREYIQSLPEYDEVIFKKITE